MRYVTACAVLPLLCAGAACAEPAPLTLKAVATFQAGAALAVSPDFSVAASGGKKSVRVWRLSDGRQTGRFDAPVDKLYFPETPTEDFTVDSVSPDASRLLVSRYQMAAAKGDHWSQSEKTVFMMSVADGAFKELWKRRGGCRFLDDNEVFKISVCPRARASFLSDGRAVVRDLFYGGSAFYQSRSKDVLETSLTLLDEKGKPVSELKGRGEESKIVGRPYRTVGGDPGVYYSNVDGLGRLLGAAQDDAGCEVRDLAAKKRMSFLDGCTEQLALDFGGNGLAFTNPDHSAPKVAKVWDASTGRLLLQTDAVPVKVIRAAAADLAFVQIKDEVLEIRDASLKTVLRSGPFKEQLEAVSPDGRRLLARNDGTHTVYDTGMSAGPAAAAALSAAEETPAPDVDAPPASKTARDPDAYAVVVGIEKYRQEGIPAVDFAARDARTMYAYLTAAMGFDPKNVVLLTDERATKTDLEKNLKTWLANRVDARSKVFVYYAGHGAPNPATGEGYLMPYEADPNYLSDTALPVSELYAALGKLATHDVTVVLDACFSGQGGRSLLAKGARPLVAAAPAKTPPNAVVIAAAGASQISASDPGRRHGLLTEYLLEGLHGQADADGDDRVTAAEVFAYLKPAVERAARLQNIEQTPTLAGTPGARPWLVLSK